MTEQKREKERERERDIIFSNIPVMLDRPNSLIFQFAKHSLNVEIRCQHVHATHVMQWYVLMAKVSMRGKHFNNVNLIINIKACTLDESIM
jgi:hypothetical protein